MRNKLLVIATLKVLIISIFTGSVVIYANSAEPLMKGYGNGVVFQKHDKIKVTGEVLDIRMEGLHADVTATYRMKNISDENLTSKQMFLYTGNQQYYSNRGNFYYGVKRNDSDVKVLREYYVGKDRDNWEEKLASNIALNPTEVFGNLPFYKYVYETDTVDIDYENYIYNSDMKYFLFTFVENEKTTVVILTQFDELEFYYSDFVPIEENVLVEDLKSELVNLFYLNDKTTDTIEKEHNFNQYLICLNNGYTTDGMIYPSLDEVIYMNDGLFAFVYDIDFAPQEEVEVKVNYSCALGASGYRKTADFEYYLTPAKYWLDFQNLTINLYLDEKYPVLEYTSLKFDRIDKGYYQYISDKLPDKDLKITVGLPISERIWSGFGYFLMTLLYSWYIWLPILVLLVILTVVLVIIKKRRKKDQNQNIS